MSVKVEPAPFGLTERQLVEVVLFWYTERMPDIFQNEDGEDLEEICWQLIDAHNRAEEIIKNSITINRMLQ